MKCSIIILILDLSKNALRKKRTDRRGKKGTGHMFSFMKLAQADQYPGDNWDLVGSTVITGLVVVFLILVILVFLLLIMGAILGQKKKKTTEKKDNVNVAPVVEETPTVTVIEDDSDDEELIAVISAAVAAFGDTDGKQYRVVGIKKKDRGIRSGWNLSGINEQTRPF